MTLSLAFISPVLAEAAMEGRLPRGFCVKRLTDLPMLWSEQWRAVGLQQPNSSAGRTHLIDATAIHSLQILPPRSIWRTWRLGFGLSISWSGKPNFAG